MAEAVARAWEPGRVGACLSAFTANDSGETDPEPVYAHVIQGLARLGLGFLHLVEPRASGSGAADVDHQGLPSASETYRPLWPGVLVAAGNYRPDTAEAALLAGHADASAFGRLFIANPDLPERIRRDAPLNAHHRPTFYGGEAEGYTDDPAMQAAEGGG